MPQWPAGVEISTIVFGKGLSPTGLAQNAKLAVYAEFGTNMNAIVWGDDGTAMLKLIDTATAEVGAMGSVQVPVVDQDGWIDGSLSAFKLWHYRLVETVGSVTRTKYVQPLSGQGLIDFDMIPDGTVGVPTSTPVPPVTSVAGITGAVSAVALKTALDLNGTYVAVAEKGSPSGIATLDNDTKVPVAQLPLDAIADSPELSTAIGEQVAADVPPAVTDALADNPEVVEAAALRALNTEGVVTAQGAGALVFRGEDGTDTWMQSQDAVDAETGMSLPTDRTMDALTQMGGLVARGSGDGVFIVGDDGTRIGVVTSQDSPPPENVNLPPGVIRIYRNGDELIVAVGS